MDLTATSKVCRPSPVSFEIVTSLANDKDYRVVSIVENDYLTDMNKMLDFEHQKRQEGVLIEFFDDLMTRSKVVT